MSGTDRGEEIINLLIHLTDPAANHSLQDRYFHDVDLDFSRCTFVFSYNDPNKVSPVLLDRLCRVHLAPPGSDERAAIVRDHLVPRIRQRLATDLTLSDAGIEHIVGRARTHEGLRGTEKDVEAAVGAAQLCTGCGDTHGDKAGVPSERVLDAAGQIAAEFVRAILPRRLDTEANVRHMYT